MLTPSDYEHLKLLYDKFQKMNSVIKKCILEKNIDDIDTAIQEKEGMLRQIVFFEKPRIKDIKENQELNSIRLNLIELEKENMELFKDFKNSLMKEFSDIKKNMKIINAYEPQTNNPQSTIDIKEED